LFGSGMMFEEISAVAVWGEDDGPNNAVLEGFVSKRLNWHSNLEIFGENQQQKPDKAERILTAANANEKKTDYIMARTEKLYRSDQVERSGIKWTNLNELAQTNNIDGLSAPGGIRVPGGTTAPGEISIPGENDVPMGVGGVDATKGIEVPSGINVPGVNVPNGSSIPNIMPIPSVVTPRTATPGTTSPGVTTPGVTTPGTTIPGTTMTPGVTTPGTTTPRTTTPGVTTPGTTIPRTTTPGVTTPGVTTTPGTTTPGVTTPGVITPGTTIPGTTTTPGVTTPRMSTPNGLNELQDLNGLENLNELEEIGDTETDLNQMEAVQNQFKDDISGLAAKLAENISKADKMNGMSASETLANMSPHDTFRAISQRFRKELNMLDEMGIIDKKKFFGEEESEEAEKDVLKAVEPQTEITKIVEEQNNKNKKDTGFTIGEMTLTDRLFVINDKLNTDDGREWIKLDYREAYFIDNAIKDIRSLYVKNAARKARHMIIGRDGRNMFIGIPGKVSDRNNAEQNGFYEFLAVNSTSESGYWIKAI